MTTINTILENVCAGGGHFRITFTVDGILTRTAHVTRSDIQEQVTNDDLDNFARVYLKLYSKGKTALQIRNGLQAGFEVTI